MGEKIRAQHIATFLERKGPMTNDEIVQNLKTITQLPGANFLDCYLDIADDEYLTIWIDNEAPEIIIRDRGYYKERQTNKKIRAQFIATLLERKGPMPNGEIVQKLKTVTRLTGATFLDCYLEIVDDEYLTIWIDDETDPDECLDLRCIHNVHGLSLKKSVGPEQHMLVFRFLASELTNRECSDQVYILKLGTEDSLRWGTEVIGTAVKTARFNRKYTPEKYMQCRSKESKELDLKNFINAIYV
ncbi:unnamed protein product [Dibothriocephalus latus]|uniref:Uncharacterized protein n=1 Tax=Dibothriocephalus latus TaxID=60516 RepID=A0A3P7MV98_DIBLA|nr:unnamed protein product [Dibothriocephalus latus]